MADAVLRRLESSDQGTFGRLASGTLSFFAGELPWRDNSPSVSCVPLGTYRCDFTHSPRFGRHLYLLDRVPDRAGVRVHSANLMGDLARGFRSQLNGCISVGEKLGWIDGQKAVLLSAPAVRRLEDYFGGKPFTLEIR